MSKSIQLKNSQNEKMYPHPYYPVGSIYLSINNTNPSTWFGGTWELIAKGRTLVGVDENDTDFNLAGKTGGEKVHVLSYDEMPSHTHNRDAGSLVGWVGGNNGGIGFSYGANAYSTNAWSDISWGIHDAGNNQPHNNLQPYFACYIWCRTA